MWNCCREIKLPENSLKQYYRWVKEQEKNETMDTLNEWVAEEAVFQMQASEVKHGFTSRSGDRKHEDSRWSRSDGKSSKSFGTSLHEGNKKPPNNRNEDGERKRKLCRACGESHHVEKCQVFAGWPRDRKWETAKQFGLCYRCLNGDHLGNQCPNSNATYKGAREHTTLCCMTQSNNKSRRPQSRRGMGTPKL